MFDALSERFERLGTSLRSRGRLSDADLEEALGEVRAALLEADVELGVVRAFLDAVRERLSGEALSQSLSPGQQVIKAVHEQLIEVLGGSASRSPTPRSHRRSSSWPVSRAPVRRRRRRSWPRGSSNRGASPT